jgi:O-antigen/teichoic acid export membrane protein
MTGIISLVTAHVLIVNQGPHAYAVTMMIATFILMIPAADLGVGAVLINTFADWQGGRSDERATMLAACVKLLSVSCLVIVSIAVAGAALGLWARILGVRQAGVWVANLSLALVLVIFAISVVLGLSQRILVGTGHTALLVLFQAIAPAVTLMCVLVGVARHVPDYLVAVAWPIGTVVVSVICIWKLVRAKYLPWEQFVSELTQWSTSVKRVLTIALPMVVVMVALPLAQQSGRVILSHRSDTDQLAVFTVLSSLYLPLVSVLSAIGQSMWHRFALVGRKSESIGREFWSAEITLVGVGAGAALALAILGRPIVSLVSEGLISVSVADLLSFGILLVCLACQLPMGMLLTDAGGLRAQAVSSIALALVTLSLAWFLAAALGAKGVPLAMAAGIAVCQILPYSIVIQKRYIAASSANTEPVH